MITGFIISYLAPPPAIVLWYYLLCAKHRAGGPGQRHACCPVPGTALVQRRLATCVTSPNVRVIFTRLHYSIRCTTAEKLGKLGKTACTELVEVAVPQPHQLSERSEWHTPNQPFAPCPNSLLSLRPADYSTLCLNRTCRPGSRIVKSISLNDTLAILAKLGFGLSQSCSHVRLTAGYVEVGMEQPSTAVTHPGG